MASDEPNAGGTYQFAEPQQECRFYPRKSGVLESATILAKAAAWYGGKIVPVIDGEVIEPGRLTVRFIPPAGPTSFGPGDEAAGD